MTSRAERPAPRPEQEVFDDLAKLCALPGYAEAIAVFCLRDNIIDFRGAGVTADALAHTFSRDRLLRTEISTLIGLLARNAISDAVPNSAALQDYLSRTETLLQELHDVLGAELFGTLKLENPADLESSPFSEATVFREPIFYGGESAYSFQYRDFAVAKYGADDGWLRAHRDFSIVTARNVVQAVGELQIRKVSAHMGAAVDEAGPLLPAFSFTASEVADLVRQPEAVVRPILDAFALDADDRNSSFKTLQDFNAANATPLLRLPDGRFLLFQIYSLAEALYETPFYWMGTDKEYAPRALKNRGVFTERFALECLKRVFGPANVYANVILPGRKRTVRGEIDTLVLFGDRAIIVQAKSKRLTLEARKGNDLQLKDDFKKAIQDACDQCMDCAAALIEPG